LPSLSVYLLLGIHFIKNELVFLSGEADDFNYLEDLFLVGDCHKANPNALFIILSLLSSYYLGLVFNLLFSVINSLLISLLGDYSIANLLKS
jgi:hypothetical protein